MNVLIIDDDLPWAELAAVILRTVADRIKISTTYADAQATIRKPNGFDVVMLDMNLPDSPANETLQHLGEIKATGRKIVVMTGADVDDFMRQAAKQCGAEDLLYKGDIHFADKIRAACT